MGLIGGAGRRGLEISALALAIAIQACGTGASSGSPRFPEPTTESHEGDVSKSAGLVERLGERFPAHYAGLELLAGQVVVYRKASTDFDQALRGLHLPVEVVVRDAPYAAAELQPLAERIQGDSAYWRGLGVPISTVGALHDGTAVEVGTERPDQASRLFPQRYGTIPPVVVVRMGPMELIPNG